VKGDLIMDAKTIFQPKIWYIICGAMALIGGIENNINAESWADSAWGADGVNDQSIAMEKLFGLFMAGFGVMGLACAFVLSGSSQAKFAMANGGIMMGFFPSYVCLTWRYGIRNARRCLPSPSVLVFGWTDRLRILTPRERID
jgi:hypothetical protein